MQHDVIRVVLPVALKDVFDKIAPSFKSLKGHEFEVTLLLNPEVPDHIATGADWCIALSNPQFIEQVVAAGDTDGKVYDLGYSPLAFAALKQFTPPIQSKDEIASCLLKARSIAITGAGTSGLHFWQLTGFLGITEAVRRKTQLMPGGEPIAALLAGKVELAALPLTNVAPIENVFARVICPLQFDVHIGLSFCVCQSANGAGRQFADWLHELSRGGKLQSLGLEGSQATG